MEEHYYSGNFGYSLTSFLNQELTLYALNYSVLHSSDKRFAVPHTLYNLLALN